MAASTCSSSTGVITGTDPYFTLAYKPNGDQGLFLMVKYGRVAASNLTITIDAYNRSLHPTGLTGAALAIGSTKPNVATKGFFYYINGILYSKGSIVAGTVPGNDVITSAKYGAVAFDIDANGTINAIEATDQAAQQFTSAALAVASLPAVASGFIRMGYVTASKSDGDFTFGTTNLDAANTTVAYTSLSDVYRVPQLTGSSLGDLEMVISATSNKRIPVIVNSSEKIVIANLTVGSAGQGNSIIANFVES